VTTNYTISKTEYESIVASYEELRHSSLALDDTLKPHIDSLKTLLEDVDDANSITRYYIGVRWDDLSVRAADYEDYPPQQEELFHSYTAFTEQWVLDFVEAQTVHYANVLVTDDPSGNVGWVTVSAFFA
jgi:hypothetical protein